MLYKAKMGLLRKSLKDFMGKNSTGRNREVSSVLEEICPQNAHLVHFTVNYRFLFDLLM